MIMKKFIAAGLLLLIGSQSWAAHNTFTGTSGSGASVTCDAGTAFIWLSDEKPGGTWGGSTVSLEMMHPSGGATPDWRPVRQAGVAKTWNVNYMENVNVTAAATFRLTFANGVGTNIDWVLNCAKTR